MVFCDWLSIYQEHDFPVPSVFAGRVFSVDQDGAIEWDICKKLKHKGSHATNLLISADGNRVTLSGNIGRFNRGDNVFGYSVLDCIKLANQVLESLGLPPFTDGQIVPLGGSSTQLFSRSSHAIITRVDLTRNWATGSENNAAQAVRYFQGFRIGKFEPEPYSSLGVSWGEGSKYVYHKLYNKASDYIRHMSKDNQYHNEQLYDYILTSGVLRQESTFKSRYLTQNNLSRISHWVDGMEAKVLALYSSPYSEKIKFDDFLEIPGRAGEIALAWRDGADLKTRLSKNTFSKYKRELIGYGIDITVPANIRRLNTQVEIITLCPLALPNWYELPKVA